MATFADAATRLLYSVDPVYERGKPFIQLDSGETYIAIRGGAGAASWELIGRPLVRREISVYDWCEVSSAGDVGAIAAIGGRLASDTTPILEGDAAESAQIRWAAGNADIIGFQFALNTIVSGGVITVALDVFSGTTDAASMLVELGFDGAALISATADDTATKSATRHTITASFTAANVPDNAKQCTIMLTPPAHATNAIQLLGCVVSY